MIQEEFKRALRSEQQKLMTRRIADIEAWVQGRMDNEKLRLPSLAKLTARDLMWLAAAIDNS